MKKFRNLGAEDYLVIAIGVVLMVLVLYFLTACSAQRAKDVHVVWSNGKCILVANGMSIAQAKEMKQHWKFEDCTVIIEDDLNEGAKK